MLLRLPVKLIVVNTSSEHTVWLKGEAPTVSEDSAVIFCVNMGDVLGSNPPPPEKAAVIECAPAGNEVEKVATEPATAEVPSGVAPSKNWTVPVDTPAGVSVAVNITVLVLQAGFLLEVTVVVVAVCPKVIMETRNKKVAEKKSFFLPGTALNC